ncbi:MAG: hypothetical protein QOE05_3370 [Actinomycetota bacterium]|nr:hypothetical protein [Actinomycetota bacterium]
MDAKVLVNSRLPKAAETEGAAYQLARNAYFESRRTAGDVPLTIEQAAAGRVKAAKAAKTPAEGGVVGPPVGPAWQGIGPNPTSQIGRTSGALENVTGRIGAIAVNSAGKIFLGAAQGGLWTLNASTGAWTPQGDTLPSLAVGALAIAPSDQQVMYLGTGEGALSGDSYFGNGIYRSNDAGATWTQLGPTFVGSSISRITVDASNPNHLYATNIRGRGGIRRTTPPTNGAFFGVWESTNGGSSWVLRKGTQSTNGGGTDVEIDPTNGNVVYATFWGDTVYKSTDHGLHWATAATGLPDADWAGGASRISIAISRPSAAQPAVLYAGTDWVDQAGVRHLSRLWRSADDAAHWTELPGGSGIDAVRDYCGTQCTYDNVVEVDPTDPNAVFAGGMYNYGLASGGIYRSLDGGQTWLSLGFDLHPDFHALAFQPGATSRIVIGNDGGVWESPDRGGRLAPGATLADVDWTNLNAGGLQITQFTSITYDPVKPNRFWGGTQDNGTQAKSSGSNRWFDAGQGDGGQVLVDPVDGTYVFGTRFNTSPYRFDHDTLAAGFIPIAATAPITRGIDLNDRTEFYDPFVMNKANRDQLFLGTYRLYRTDNATTANPADVQWAPISPDLTSGCPGAAPNGARGCFLSAIGVADGGNAVYTGSDDGYVYVSENAVTSASPTWKRVDKGALPARPVSQFAVDRSDWRVAYVSYTGFSAATPRQPGMVFKTINGGKSWKNVTSNLPDAPVNSVVLDPSDRNRLYVGSDVGAFVSTNGGQSWSQLGTSLPNAAIWQLDYDPARGLAMVGTHGRGAWRLPTGRVAPALVVAVKDTGIPVGPDSTLTYRLSMRNVGNAAATDVAVTDLIPIGTTFVSASDGGVLSRGRASWSGLSVAAGAEKVLTLVVHVDPGFTGTSIVNDRVDVTSTNGVLTSGSPRVTTIASPRAVTLTPATQTNAARSGESVTYPVTLHNSGYLADSYAVGATGAWPATVLDATCTSPLTTTATVAPGSDVTVCVRVSVPAAATDGTAVNTAVTATSTGSAAVSASGTVRTIAVTVDTLFVDDDGNAPDVAARYAAALPAGTTYSTWDLAADPELPDGYIAAHRTVIWWTGNAYPSPVTRYEGGLAQLLDRGGRLLMSGQDILDQAGGQTPFFENYLHILWDGSEAQNDKPTGNVTGQAADPVGAGQGVVPLDHNVLGAAFEDQVTLDGAPGTSVAFKDDAGQPNGVSIASSGYKAVFLGFPFEAYGSAAQRSSLMSAVLTWFATP